MKATEKSQAPLISQESQVEPFNRLFQKSREHFNRSIEQEYPTKEKLESLNHQQPVGKKLHILMLRVLAKLYWRVARKGVPLLDSCDILSATSGNTVHILHHLPHVLRQDNNILMWSDSQYPQIKG